METNRTAIEQASSYLTEHPEAARSTDSAATAVLEDGGGGGVRGPRCLGVLGEVAGRLLYRGADGFHVRSLPWSVAEDGCGLVADPLP